MVSQALMPKRCNVLLETVKELPPLQVLEKNGDGLCHGSAKPVEVSPLAIAQDQSTSMVDVTSQSRAGSFPQGLG
jgi:hypothetical protein